MLKIKNADVIKVYNLLINMTLPFKDSRLRVKFCRKLGEHNDYTYLPARQEILNHFVYTDNEGVQRVPLDKIELFDNEIQILENECFELECNEINKDVLLKINEILHNEDLFPSLQGEDAMIHDTLCDEFEEIKRLYNK